MAAFARFHRLYGAPTVSKGPWDFKLTNVKRLCKAVRAEGVEIGRVEFDKATGNIVVYPEKGEPQVDENPLIERLRKVKP